ncbi:DEAD/DEAH box helicase domain protein [Paraburkholderia atlantica]|uniref:DEAD/DEAH box helicase domain protein n=1 Tax=Paraburkholderia atlantica TaxID=2654982 RepID=D5WIZ9_PARAM|nr:DEAD/DEAH box helicase domain protein [Paraburkholderia atlantica]
MTEPPNSDDPADNSTAAPAPSDERVRAPRPRRIPRSRAQQARLDAREPAFEPLPFPSYSPDAARRPFADKLDAWFASRHWQPFEFQREVWRNIAAGASGVLHASTGAGKTWAVWFGALTAFASAASTPRKHPEPLTVLWITPMRALAADTARALQSSAAELAVPWSVGLRTGDTSAAERERQNRRMPSALVTTPESLTLILTRADAREVLSQVRLVIVDEWHELLGNKRGTQTQLALARLTHWRAGLQVWGLSATLGNLSFATEVLLAPVATPRVSVHGALPKALIVDTIIPDTIERFPWGGHMGMRQVDAVARAIDEARTSLVFTNTRSQCEVWYQALLDARPEWAGVIALHHGSLDQQVREWVERGLKNGLLKVVVCTSSLDLGVDFLPVERVFQIGSPKGVARLMQRAGRSGHAPGLPSRVTIVPTHALELIEAAAAREAVDKRQIESRDTPHKPFDVLVQHLVTVAIGGGFDARELYDELLHTYAYRDLTQQEFDWALNFVEGGGATLRAYPDYHRVARDSDGLYRVPRNDLARRHRNNIGTIREWHVECGVSIGRAHWCHRGIVHLATQARRCVHVRRPRAGTDPRAGHDGVGATCELIAWGNAAMGRQPHAVIVRTRRRDSDDTRARRRRHLRRTGNARGAAAARIAAEVVSIARAGRAGHRVAEIARGSPLLLLSIRRAHRAYWAWCCARVASRARQTRHVFDFDERLRFRIAMRAGVRLGRATAQWPALT